MKKITNYEVGKRYRGYGTLNEYGEFTFEPENTGSRAGVIKHVVNRNGVGVSHSKEYVIVHFKVKRGIGFLNYVTEIGKKVNELFRILKEYDI